MKRRLFVVGLAALLTVLAAPPAFAAGWWVEYGNNTGNAKDGRITAPSNSSDGPNVVFDSRSTQDPDGTGPAGAEPLGNLGQGNPNTPDIDPLSGGPGVTPSPHGDFSASSNKCKTCHAVHGANDTSFRMLHDVGRTTECNWCHEASTGRSSHRPYGEMTLAGQSVRGEHTLGATRIPDSNANTCAGSGTVGVNCGNGDLIDGKYWGRLPDRGDGGYGLNCYYCHTVHGSDRIEADVRWKQAILRRDPAGNGGPRSGANEPLLVDWKGTQQLADAGSSNYVKAAFCADCHNRNPNHGTDAETNQAWNDTNSNGVLDTGETFHISRPNPGSHPTRGNGLVEIYGQSSRQVSNGLDSCVTCHSASTFTSGEFRLPNGPSDFPHQSRGHKLLQDGFINDDLTGVTTAGDPYRPLPAQDQICLFCHGSFVGVTF